MSPRRNIVVAAAAAVLAASFATAAAAGPWSLAPGEYETELLGSQRSSNSFYDDGGTRIGRDGRDEARGATWSTELGWTKRWSFQMSVPAVSVTDQTASSRLAVSRAGLGDLAFGLRASLLNKASAAAFQLQWQAPAGYDRALTPALGDGQQRLSAGLELGRALGHFGFVQAGGGYLYDYRMIGSRSTDPADGEAKTDWGDHVVADGALAFWIGRLQVAGQYAGQFAGATGRSTKTTAQMAGPRLTYRVDGRLDAFAGSWHTPAGKNTDHFDEYYAGIAWKMTRLNRLQGFLGGDTRP